MSIDRAEEVIHRVSQGRGTSPPGTPSCLCSWGIWTRPGQRRGISDYVYGCFRAARGQLMRNGDVQDIPIASSASDERQREGKDGSCPLTSCGLPIAIHQFPCLLAHQAIAARTYLIRRLSATSDLALSMIGPPGTETVWPVAHRTRDLHGQWLTPRSTSPISRYFGGKAQCCLRSIPHSCGHGSWRGP
jgi:hypothetical protein